MMVQKKEESDVLDLFYEAVGHIEKEYQLQRSVVSFEEYLSILEKRPRNNMRDASQYLLDAINYFGKEDNKHPWEDGIRFKLFDQKFNGMANPLVGQERSQKSVNAAIASQTRDGRVNRLILIHGPNGSAKSTLVNCLFNGLEHYSRLEQGELYRFRWVFPTRKTSHGKIGFGGRLEKENLESFAHLDDDQIDATLECEMRDHPLLLLPKDRRKKIMETALEKAGATDYQIPDYLLNASLCHRCRQVADALMRIHRGNLQKVLAHVQIERWAMSKRYCRGLVRLGPQLSVDAGQRQVTADRSLSALPIELQNITMFETFGPLVDAAGGILVFEDMFKRPLDALKYLLSLIESQETMLSQSILQSNSVLIGTTNDLMLEAFKEHPEFPSFRDRINMVPVPYMTRKNNEAKIYELLLSPNIQKHIAPHAMSVAAHWSVLTRLHKPNPSQYPENLQAVIKNLTAAQKCDLYNEGVVPDALTDDEATALVEHISDISSETSDSWQYEGRYGASPRLVRQILLTASLNDGFKCLSPFAVLDEIAETSKRSREYKFLETPKEEGGYHDFKDFIKVVESKLLDDIETELGKASGLIEAHKHSELLDKYILHVSHAIKNEKLRNETTGDLEAPDEHMMRGVEKSLGIGDSEALEYRKKIISRIAAWAIEHPGQKVIAAAVLPAQLKKIKEDFFKKHREKVGNIATSALAICNGDTKGFNAEKTEEGTLLIENLIKDEKYCQSCVKDAIGHFLSKRLKIAK